MYFTGSSQFRDPGNQHSPILQHNGGNTPSISGLSPEASPIPHTQRPQDSPMALPSEQDFSDSDSEAASAMQNAATSGHHSPLLQSGVPTPQPQDPSTPTDEQLSVRVLVDARTVGQIIGKGGATITSFRQASGALIEITKNDQNGVVHRIITVKGSVEPVCSALQMLADAQSSEFLFRRYPVEFLLSISTQVGVNPFSLFRPHSRTRAWNSDFLHLPPGPCAAG